MDAKEIIIRSLKGTANVISLSLADLADEDLLVRPVPGANHIAWQLGHLICACNNMMNLIKPGSMPELPPGFAAAHAKDRASDDRKENFLTKSQYMELMDKQREAVISLINDFPPDQLDQPGPERIRALAPKNADLFSLQASHPMMHVGQFTVVRRLLNKPIVM